MMHIKPISIKLPSRVSRRILLTVALCAVIPIAVLVCLTLYSTQQRLQIDTQARLQFASKNIAIALLSELSAIETEVRQLALRQSPEIPPGKIADSPLPFRKKTIKQTWLFSSVEQLSELPYQPTAETIQRLNSGLPQLTIRSGTPQNILLLWVPIQFQNWQWGISVAEVDISQLLSQAKLFLPEKTRVLLIDYAHKRHLFDSQYAIPEDIGLNSFEIDFDHEKYLTGHWQLPLKIIYNTSPWHITVAEPKKLLYSALLDLQINTALTAFATLWVIVIASLILVRKTLKPLKEFRVATSKISSGDFNLNLKINSNDEFAMLAESFATMATKIQSQIIFQQNLGQTVRDIYGASSEDRIVRNFFSGLDKIFNSDAASLVIYTKELNCYNTKRWMADSVNPKGSRTFPLAGFSLNDYAQLIKSSGHFVCSNINEYPLLIRPFTSPDIQEFMHFHTTIDGRQGAILTLARLKSYAREEVIAGITQLIDQLGIALSRQYMVGELESLNMGILTALARTVDANSPWTHGHSERVTEYALNIARILGFSQEQRHDLQCAGLLHDLGKISIASEVLNKPAPLSPEEIILMRKHPSEGDRIIEPISALAGIRQIVSQHHERWDGSGYPDGLKSHDICIGARILAVADVYDALYSDRPYRSGWPQEKVISYLQKNAGKAFDPAIVEAFIKTLNQKAA